MKPPETATQMLQRAFPGHENSCSPASTAALPGSVLKSVLVIVGQLPRLTPPPQQTGLTFSAKLIYIKIRETLSRGGPHPELGWLRQEAHEFEARLGYTERYLLNQLPPQTQWLLKNHNSLMASYRDILLLRHMLCLARTGQSIFIECISWLLTLGSVFLLP